MHLLNAVHMCRDYHERQYQHVYRVQKTYYGALYVIYTDTSNTRHHHTLRNYQLALRLSWREKM